MKMINFESNFHVQIKGKIQSRIQKDPTLLENLKHFIGT